MLTHSSAKVICPLCTPAFNEEAVRWNPAFVAPRIPFSQNSWDLFKQHLRVTHKLSSEDKNKEKKEAYEKWKAEIQKKLSELKDEKGFSVRELREKNAFSADPNLVGSTPPVARQPSSLEAHERNPSPAHSTHAPPLLGSHNCTTCNGVHLMCIHSSNSLGIHRESERKRRLNVFRKMHPKGRWETW
ncbi:hypothetical protein T439DRAFT_108690 [Meredithblackwellia eburnea MCA 4105]